MKIMITGNAGEGKTTLATLIAKALDDAGITAWTIQDEDLPQSYYTANSYTQRVAAIAQQRAPVVIECVQTARPVPQPILRVAGA